MHNSFGSCLEAQACVSAPANCPEGIHVSLPTSEWGPYPPAFFTWWRKNSLHSFPLGSNVERAFPTVNLGSELLKLSFHQYLSLPTFEMTVSPKQDAVGRRGLMFTKQEKGYRYSLQTCMHVCTNMYVCVYTHVYTWFYSIWNVSKAEVEVEDMDAPWMEGWMLLWAGRKLGHAEDGKPVTGEMIIVLLNVNYPWI